MPTKDPDVVVVGAGIAGASVAADTSAILPGVRGPCALPIHGRVRHWPTKLCVLAVPSAGSYLSCMTTPMCA